VSLVITHQAGRREWIGLAVLTLPCLLYAMDLTVLNLAVPHLSADLRPSSTQLLWIVDIYGFLAAGSLVTMGTLGDRIGRRRLLLIGAAAFGAASVLAAWSTSAPMLIAARALLGVAGATVAPSTLSLIRNMFGDPRQRTVAISVWITSFSVGGAIGPLLGGLLLKWFWWGSVFLLAVPVMALLLVLGPLLLPEFRDTQAGRPDMVSAVLSVGAVLAVIYGLKQLAHDGSGWPPALFIVVGLAAGVVFVRRQHRLADPLLDLRLFRSAAFTTALTTNLLSFFAGFGALLFIAQYLQLVLGLSPLTAGLWMLPSSAGTILGSMLTPLLARRLRPAFVMAAGMALAAVGLALFTQLGSAVGLGILVTGSVVFSLALAPVDTLATDLAVGAAPPERAGAASALSETAAEFGGALGIAILGVIGTSIYRSQLTDAAPAGVLSKTAPGARDTLGGAVAAAGHLPGQLGHVLLGAARQAFTQGLHVAFAISAAAVLGASILTAIQLRYSRPSPEPGLGSPPDERDVAIRDPTSNRRTATGVHRFDHADGRASAVMPKGESFMLLDTKTAIVYGAGGAIGSAVARAYAREGADVHLAGRTMATLEEAAERIRHDGGAAHVAQVDVLDRAAVAQHADAVDANSGIDICFNATSNDDVQGTPLLTIRSEDFLRPVTKAVTAHFNIATAVGRHMTRRGRGVILVMAGGREAIPRLGGSHVAWAALAGLCRQLAAEFGPQGVRVSWLLSPGSPGNDEHDQRQDGPGPGETEAAGPPGTAGLLARHLPTYGEVANIAAFAASDWARTITASEINFTGGAVID
jgi:DHA2 family multidrug resistance protein-like MFS transporter